MKWLESLREATDWVSLRIDRRRPAHCWRAAVLLAVCLMAACCRPAARPVAGGSWSRS